MSTPAWRLEAQSACLELSRLSAAISLREPARGVHELRVDGELLAGCRLLQVELPAWNSTAEAESLDPYVRGQDLVVTYPERDGAAVRSQLYWRAANYPAAGGLASLELVAAAQTSRLDSNPALTIRSELIASEIFQMVDAASATFASLLPKPDGSHVSEDSSLPQCFLFRLPDGRWSYAQMVHPGDSRSWDWDGWIAGADFRLQLRHQLFGGRLEKGVILKARTRGVFLSRDNDSVAAAEHYAALAAEALPLTT